MKAINEISCTRRDKQPTVSYPPTSMAGRRESERETETETERQRQRDRDIDRQTETDRQRQTDRETERANYLRQFLKPYSHKHTL